MAAITPQDLNNAKLDVDHMAALATSVATTAVDRFGQVKKTWSGIKQELDAEYTLTAAAASRAGAESAQVGALQAKADTTLVRDQAFAGTNARPSIAIALADATIAVGASFTAPLPDGSFQSYTKTSTTVATAFGAPGATKALVDEVAHRVGLNPVGSDIINVATPEGSVTLRQDTQGKLFLPHLDVSVQDAIAVAGLNHRNPSSYAGDLAQVRDLQGSVTMRQAVDGGFHLPGPNGSIQDQIAGARGNVATVRRNPRDRLSAASQDWIDALLTNRCATAPVPFGLQPQRYTVPNSIVDAFALSPGTPRIPLNSPYGRDDKVVHPHLIEFYGGFRGYRYWLCINPYTYEYHENPVLYGSNDLANFEMLKDIDQPLGWPELVGPDFLSDSGFTFDPVRGRLICYWRFAHRPDEAVPGRFFVTVYYRATTDGINWTPKAAIIDHLDSDIDIIASPSILFDPVAAIWHMWTTPQAGAMRHSTAPDLEGPWTVVSTVTPPTIGIWHTEVKFVGDKFVMLVNKRDPGSNYYLGISSDGEAWTWGNTPLFSTQEDALYKASFVPTFDAAGRVALDVAWTTNHASTPDAIRRFFIGRTNFISI